MGNQMANQIVALLAREPKKGDMVVDGTYGFRLDPEEVFIRRLGVYIRLSDMAIHAVGGQYHYPGPIKRWALHRFFKWWRDQVPLPPVCHHPVQTERRWTQDGYVSRCRMCNRIQFHGDEHE